MACVLQLTVRHYTVLGVRRSTVHIGVLRFERLSFCPPASISEGAEPLPVHAPNRVGGSGYGFGFRRAVANEAVARPGRRGNEVAHTTLQNNLRRRDRRSERCGEYALKKVTSGRLIHERSTVWRITGCYMQLGALRGVVSPDHRSIDWEDPVESLRLPFDGAHCLGGEVWVGWSRGMAFASMKSWMINVL